MVYKYPRTSFNITVTQVQERLEYSAKQVRKNIIACYITAVVMVLCTIVMVGLFWGSERQLYAFIPYYFGVAFIVLFVGFFMTAKRFLRRRNILLDLLTQKMFLLTGCSFTKTEIKHVFYHLPIYPITVKDYVFNNQEEFEQFFNRNPFLLNEEVNR